MRKFLCFLFCVTITLITTALIVKTNAHSVLLEVEYDDCIKEDYVDESDIGDGINERWYYLLDRMWNDNFMFSYYHLSHNIKTLKYYISPIGKENTSYTWTTDVDQTIATEIKTAFVNSMKQWNDVYFYSYNQDGIRTKNKVINIEEGTASDYDIIIYPEPSNYDNMAGMNTLGSATSASTGRSITYHSHYSQFFIRVNLSYFYVGGKPEYTQEMIDLNRQNAGAHEMGHILGLGDIDEYCTHGGEISDYHHEEVLMGSSKNHNPLAFQPYITYKDLAGVAITRGFHTDSDHRWLIDTDQLYDGKYKKICSICNGIEYVSTISGNYYEYNYCQGVHTLSSNNMMAVGCKGDKDFIKCKYCRYVAPVEDMVTQNYTYQSIDSSTHRITNSVNGLNYTINEAHTYIYSLYSTTQHKSTCACGRVVYETHSITEADYTDGDNIAICIQCKKIVNLDDGMFPVLPSTITKYSINGSFILPNGIIVLVEEDIQSYLNNTLIFYREEDLPQIE